MEEEIKLNVDVSLDHSGGGIGGLLRNSSGVCFAMFSELTERDTIYALELLAISHGISLVSAHGVQKMWIESGSMFAIDILNGKSDIPWTQIQQIETIRTKLRVFNSSRITHIWCESNSAADYLSKRSCTIKGQDLDISYTSPNLLSIIEEDSQGNMYLRKEGVKHARS
ncbi:uncharacterized protein LOC143882953 [Tasmannia lanceolata]|uniref:uncharacterized protein LOC143882953 n=1 Tax=Tasmannia lanceolata TaxID=3420 RepID=UPI004062950A